MDKNKHIVEYDNDMVFPLVFPSQGGKKTPVYDMLYDIRRMSIPAAIMVRYCVGVILRLDLASLFVVNRDC